MSRSIYEKILLAADETRVLAKGIVYNNNNIIQQKVYLWCQSINAIKLFVSDWGLIRWGWWMNKYSRCTLYHRLPLWSPQTLVGISTWLRCLACPTDESLQNNHRLSFLFLWLNLGPKPARRVGCLHRRNGISTGDTNALDRFTNQNMSPKSV